MEVDWQLFWVVNSARECAKELVQLVLLYNVHVLGVEVVEAVKYNPHYDTVVAGVVEVGNCKNDDSLELLLVGHGVSSSVLVMAGQEQESQQTVVVAVVVKRKNDNLVVVVVVVTVTVVEELNESDDQEGRHSKLGVGTMEVQLVLVPVVGTNS